MAIKEIATSGSDGASGNPGSPWATLEHALENVGPGDVIDIRSGTYNQLINDGSQTVPSGTATSPITIQGHVGETVTLRPTNTPRVVTLSGARSYLYFSRLILDGINQQSVFSDGISLSGSCHNIKFLNCSVLNTWHSGVYSDASNCQFIDVLFQDIGIDPTLPPASPVAGHGLYLTGDGNLMKRVTIIRVSGYGVHIFKQDSPYPDNNLVIYSRIKNYGHEFGGPSYSAAGVILSRGNNNAVIRTLIYDGDGDGIALGLGGSGAKALYNTVHNCTAGITVGTSDNATVIGNILAFNGAAYIDHGGGTGRTLSKNMSNAAGAGIDLVANPLFVNAGAEDFTLQAASPAINAGIPQAGVLFKGSAPDLGAFEYGPKQEFNAATGRWATRLDDGTLINGAGAYHHMDPFYAPNGYLGYAKGGPDSRFVMRKISTGIEVELVVMAGAGGAIVAASDSRYTIILQRIGQGKQYDQLDLIAVVFDTVANAFLDFAALGVPEINIFHGGSGQQNGALWVKNGRQVSPPWVGTDPVGRVRRVTLLSPTSIEMVLAEENSSTQTTAFKVYTRSVVLSTGVMGALTLTATHTVNPSAPTNPSFAIL